ncbi:unnamed protein product [Hymenolepis diminuta]|uniref:Uncharacterized protein n=1 Tax=Hymenolepis diminuta TaxID=6216 RepID=A0A564YFM9_HYMDI|nr:unnamed protein product [Hymenolepis diminuta]
MRLFLAGVLTANNSQQMPISYLSNTSHLLKGLCQGKLSQIFLYQILLISSLATSLACDPSDLPRGTRVTAHGPVLKVICEPGLQAFEMTPASISTFTADDRNRLLPIPTKRKFARFICMYGTTYQRINPKGVDPTLFFCADKVKTECDDLEYSPEHGHLLIEGTVALWQPVSSNKSQSRVLYCLHGTWYHLDGEPLPGEITIKYRPKKGTTITIPTITTTTTATPSNTVEKNLETVSEPISQNLEYPPKKSMLYNPFHLPNLCLPPFLRLRTTTTTTPKPLILPKNEESQDIHFPQRDIIVIAQSVSLALHENLHRCTRIAFYCMVVIGIMTLLISLMIFLYICRRRALLAADAIEAQKRLKHSISVV